MTVEDDLHICSMVLSNVLTKTRTPLGPRPES